MSGTDARKAANGATVREAAPRRPTELLRGSRSLFLALALSFSICAGIRFLDHLVFASPRLVIDAEVVLADGDSYGWMSGAKGLAHTRDMAPSVLLRLLGSLTGWKYTAMGFWLPMILAPLAVIPPCLLAWGWGIPEAGVLSGVVSGACNGFLSRTRLGLFDTDLLALFFPALLSALLILWVEAMGEERRNPDDTSSDMARLLPAAVVLGLVYRSYRCFYPSGEPIAFAVTCMALLVGVTLVRRSMRLPAFCGILLILMTGGGDPRLLLSSLAVGAIALLRPRILENRRAPLALALLLSALSLSGTDLNPKNEYLKWQWNRYAAPVTGAVPLSDAAPAVGLLYPATLQSVREAQKIPFPRMVQLVANSWAAFILGLLGFTYVALRRPAVLILLPLLLLGLFSCKLGIRFSMYGGFGIGIGLAGAAAFALKERGCRAGIRWGIQLALCALFLLPTVGMMAGQRIPPFVPKVMGEALVRSRALTPEDSRYWTWWDFGYVTRYLAERATIADGSMNDDRLVYPLARIHAAGSPALAHRLMTYASGKENRAAPNPFTGIYSLDDGSQHDFFHREGDTGLPPDPSVPDQYLMLTWENLTLLDTIMRLGTWDLRGGRGRSYRTVLLQGRMQVDLKRGCVTIDGEEHRLREAVVLTEKSSRTFRFENPGGRHAVINRIIGHVYLMEERAFRSNMVQMLVSDPEGFKPHFQIVMDVFPWFRLYKLSGGANGR